MGILWEYGLFGVWAFGSNVANGLIEPFVWHLERSVSRGRNVCRNPVRNVWIFDLEGALLRCRKPTGSDVKTHWFGRDSPLLPSPFSTYKVTKIFWHDQMFLHFIFPLSAPFCWWIVDKYCTPNFVIINRRCDFAFGYKKTSILTYQNIYLFTYILIYYILCIILSKWVNK